jgi:hypothetical protein
MQLDCVKSHSLDQVKPVSTFFPGVSILFPLERLPTENVFFPAFVSFAQVT